MVTGAGRGLGREIAFQLLRHGVGIAALVRDRQRVDEIEAFAAKRRLPFWCIGADLRDAESISNAMVNLQKSDCKIDILVNNAAVYLDNPRRGLQNLLSHDINLLEETLDVNFLGAARLAWGIMPGMIERGFGRIVNVSSGMGRMLDFDSVGPFYRLSKLALNGLTLLLAEHGRGRGVLVNAVCPGWINTEMGGARAPRTVVQGASGVVWAALLPCSGPTGSLFRDKEPLDWYHASSRDSAHSSSARPCDILPAFPVIP